jgi:hypothetical protein
MWSCSGDCRSGRDECEHPDECHISYIEAVLLVGSSIVSAIIIIVGIAWVMTWI